MKHFTFLLSLFFLSSCAGLPTSPLHAPISAKEIAGDKNSLQTIHQLTFTKGTTSHTILLHSNINAQAISMVGLGTLGETIFECRLDSGPVNCNAITESIPATMLFNDLQLIYSPLTAIQNQMNGTDFTITQHENQRIITHKNTTFSNITYDNNDIWNANISFKNIRYGYDLHLHPLHVERNNHE